MKYIVVRFILKSLKKISKIQLGNPYHTPPTYVLEPKDEDKVECPFNTTDASVWNLKKVLCTTLYWGAIINSSNSVYLRLTRFPWGAQLHPVFISPYIGRKRISLEKAVFVIATDAKENYFHWMIDILPRLLLISNSKLDDLSERYLILDHQPRRSYEFETLSLLGIQKDKVIKLKKFELASVEDLATTEFSGTYEKTPFPKWKREIFIDFKNKVLRYRKTRDFKKIYLLRGKQGKRRLIGEEKLVNILSEIGFHIIDPQVITVVEQIEILSGAEVVVAPHGAALTNIIFCKESTLVIELRSTNMPPEFFSEIAKTCHLKFQTINLPPKNFKNDKYLANKENLVLTDEAMQLLVTKLENIPTRNI